jgi:hypothetical protein
MLSGAGSLVQQCERNCICVLTAAAILVMRRQSQQCLTTATMDVFGGPAGNALQSSKSLEVGGNVSSEGMATRDRVSP